MTVRAAIVVLGTSAIVIPTFGTTVEWNFAHAQDSEVWDTGPLWQIGGESAAKQNLFFNFFITHDYLNYIASDKIKPSQFDSIWLRQVSFGDVVDHGSMFQPDQEYFYRWQGDTSTFASDYSIPIDWDETVYLAMAIISYHTGEELIYGWIELGMGDDFDPVVKSSAWDVDGGAMYVGGGAVPEPTSALLVLLGGAALLLRRRRRL